VQNKIGQLVANPFVRNVLCQWKPTIDLVQIMDRRQILIVRLPKGSLGEEPAHLVGSLMVAGFLHAAMRRPPERRHGYHLYVDEFQNFTTSAFTTILSEARKFSLSLCVAHQYVDQLPEPIRKAVFGNVGSMVVFRVGARDAETLMAELGAYRPELYRSLARGRVVGRMISDGQVGQAFQGWTVPQQSSNGHAAKVLAKSRRTYARSRAEVESRIGAWLAN